MYSVHTYMDVSVSVSVRSIATYSTAQPHFPPLPPVLPTGSLTEKYDCFGMETLLFITFHSSTRRSDQIDQGPLSSSSCQRKQSERNRRSECVVIYQSSSSHGSAARPPHPSDGLLSSFIIIKFACMTRSLMLTPFSSSVPYLLPVKNIAFTQHLEICLKRNML